MSDDRKKGELAMCSVHIQAFLNVVVRITLSDRKSK